MKDLIRLDPLYFLSAKDTEGHLWNFVPAGHTSCHAPGKVYLEDPAYLARYAYDEAINLAQILLSQPDSYWDELITPPLATAAPRSLVKASFTVTCIERRLTTFSPKRFVTMRKS